jgi:rubredoxin
MEWQWECEICGYIHDDEEPPNACPVCGAPGNKFVEKYEDEDLLSDSSEKEESDEEEDYYGEFQ